MKIKTAIRQVGISAREAVAFIHNRHCSTVRLHWPLRRAIDRAEFCRVEESTIAADILTVASYGDLTQYVRNSQPYFDDSVNLRS